jgi:hypothetical protein
MACATSSLSSSRGLSLDSHPQDKIRLAFYQLTVETPANSALKKVGELCLEGCIGSFALYKDTHSLFHHYRRKANYDNFITDALTLAHVDPSCHLVIQSVHLASHANSLPTGGQALRSSNIGLSNPFKALKSFSVEQTTVAEDGDKVDQVQIGELCEIGNVSIPEPILGIRVWTPLHEQVVRILIWSDTHLVVS